MHLHQREHGKLYLFFHPTSSLNLSIITDLVLFLNVLSDLWLYLPSKSYNL